MMMMTHEFCIDLTPDRSINCLVTLVLLYFCFFMFLPYHKTVLVLVLGIDLGHLEVLVLVLGIDLGHLAVLVLVLGIDHGLLAVLILVKSFVKNFHTCQGQTNYKSQAKIWLLCL